ncbi:MAG: ribonuclease P protein component [Planctomycetota bacterium]|nr:ribonuclease P protein component [Planctomycetota bacterium]
MVALRPGRGAAYHGGIAVFRANALARPLAYDREKRLVRTGDFQRAFQQGSRARGSILLVVARRNGLPGTRLGLSIGKVVWKSAVKRNRVRRIFRESFRLSYPELPPGFDLVLVAASPKLEPELEATRSELVSLARKAARRFDEKAAGIAPPESGPRAPRKAK